MKKIYVVGYNKACSKIIKNHVLTDSIKNADVLIFTGGADVSPYLYNEKQHFKTFSNRLRDIAEIKVFNEAKSLNIPMIGICRGAQFLTVMNGGKLVQHVTGHALFDPHSIKIPYLNKKILITSTHHQMMYPYNLDESEYDLIAYSSQKLSKYYYKNDKEEFSFSRTEEPEIVYYYKTRSLCIQGHPEFDIMLNNKDTFNTINLIINKYIFNEK